jgi:hypothetical protein
MGIIELFLTLSSVMSVSIYIVVSALGAIAYYGTDRPRDRETLGKFFGVSFLLLCLSILCVLLQAKGYNLLGFKNSMLFLNSLILFVPILGLVFWAKINSKFDFKASLP